jgi:hypothetical protein
MTVPCELAQAPLAAVHNLPSSYQRHYAQPDLICATPYHWFSGLLPGHTCAALHAMCSEHTSELWFAQLRASAILIVMASRIAHFFMPCHKKS